jgi:hypothetical protein
VFPLLLISYRPRGYDPWDFCHGLGTVPSEYDWQVTPMGA